MDDIKDTLDISADAQAHDADSRAEAAQDRVDAAEGEARAADEAAPEQEVDRLRAELEQTREQLLRRAAEFQNYRRRTESEKLLSAEAGRTQVVREMLDVLDDMERTVEAARNAAGDDRAAAYDTLMQGAEMVLGKFVGALERLGVKPLEAEGQAFDEEQHDAMMQQPAPEGVEPGTVLTEIQRGYRMGDRVLRHSKVVVAS